MFQVWRFTYVNFEGGVFKYSNFSPEVKVVPKGSQGPTWSVGDISVEDHCINTAQCDLPHSSLILFVLLPVNKFGFALPSLALFPVICHSHLLVRGPSTSFFTFLFPPVPYAMPFKILKLRLPGPKAISIFVPISLLPAPPSPLVCFKSSVSSSRKQHYF